MGCLFKILKVVFIIVLPFFLLIRGASYLHWHYHTGPWLSLLGGVIFTSLILFLYMSFVYRRFTNKLGDADNLQRRGLFALALVAVYCGYGLFFLSSDNVKNPQLRQEISDLHPILRMAASTFVLLDKKMIITDASRLVEDYQKMGLPTINNSLHYVQKDGYAYALDLRTNNRNEIRNALMTVYFRILGFRTLRHSGTADHLHVSLPCHYLPRAK